MHNFNVFVIGDSNAVMVCRKCGKSYILTDALNWRENTFQNIDGESTDPPARECVDTSSDWTDRL